MLLSSSVPFPFPLSRAVDDESLAPAPDSCVAVTLISHAWSAGAIGILSGLPPAGKLPGVKAPLTAEGAQIRDAQATGLHHGRQRVGSAPLLRRLGGGRH